jgi:hypothetical protein
MLGFSSTQGFVLQISEKSESSITQCKGKVDDTGGIKQRS